MTSSFRSLGVPAELDAVLAAAGKTEPFPIQASTLPESLAGRDVLGRGRTGSGKTIAFAVPLVARLAASGGKRTPGRPRGLVLAPTRELATQIAATVAPLAEAMGLNAMTIFGGVSQKPQEEKLRRGVDIVVACPGRLEDLMGQGHVRLDRIEVTVLDEADHMADLGFLPGVTRILAATPQGGQRLLFSATLDRGVDKLVKRFLPSPVRCEVDELSVPAGEMTHRVLAPATLEDKTAIVRELASGDARRIMFTRTKHQAKKLARTLTAAGIPAVDLQGNLSQNARERNLAAFGAEPEDGGVRVLVATDVAARGVHVDGVELVVHVDPPEDHKAYLHRSGRTARAGASGTVATIVLPSQRGDAKALLRAASITVPFEPVAPGDAVVAELVGEKAPYRKPEPVQTQQPRKGGSKPKQTATRSVADALTEGAQKQGRRRGGRGRGAGAQADAGQRQSRGSRSQAPREGGSAVRYSSQTGDARPAQADRPAAKRAPRRAGTADVVRGGSAQIHSRGGSQAPAQHRAGEGDGARRRSGGRRVQRPQG